jgi:hypothetical protein
MGALLGTLKDGVRFAPGATLEMPERLAPELDRPIRIRRIRRSRGR